ncbi:MULTISPECIES: hypothetical protein [Massilia]|uniref:Uncharacterized protein n=1 Tax=Massilia haematophila TaxID=457923 RepID=A0ABV7PRT4_9BURK|nr:hypothetical protein [Massilia sp.]HBZ05127.1 hypothetical protein [Massilia sp.]
MSGSKKTDPRTNPATAAHVDEALRLWRTDGVCPAFEFMQLVGVPKTVAMRLLCSPGQHRKTDRRRSVR